MYCRKCGTLISDNARFCRKCGAAVMGPVKKSMKQQVSLRCIQCGKPLNEGVKFCGKCGTAINLSKVPEVSDINTVKKPVEKYQNSAPYTVQAPAQRNTQGPDVKKHFKLKPVIAIILTLIFFITLYVKRDAVINLFSFNDSGTLSSNPGGGSEPKPVLSGTKAFDITPVDGVRLTAAKNALDKERTFSVTRFNDEEMLSMLRETHTEDIPVAAFKIDGGMKDDEYLPGSVNVELDLEKLQFPENMWDQLGVYRVMKMENGWHLKMTWQFITPICFEILPFKGWIPILKESTLIKVPKPLYQQTMRLKLY